MVNAGGAGVARVVEAVPSLYAFARFAPLRGNEIADAAAGRVFHGDRDECGLVERIPDFGGAGNAAAKNCGCRDGLKRTAFHNAASAAFRVVNPTLLLHFAQQTILRKSTN